jgi:hypothetical protein
MPPQQFKRLLNIIDKILGFSFHNSQIYHFLIGSTFIIYRYFARVRNCFSAMKILKSIAKATVEGFEDAEGNLCRALWV